MCADFEYRYKEMLWIVMILFYEFSDVSEETHIIIPYHIVTFSKSPLTWIEAATAYFFLLIPVFWLTNCGPFLGGECGENDWTKDRDSSVSLFFMKECSTSSLFTLCDCIYLLVQKKKLKYSIDLSVLKKLLSKHVTNFWLASKMTNSNRWFE